MAIMNRLVEIDNARHSQYGQNMPAVLSVPFAVHKLHLVMVGWTSMMSWANGSVFSNATVDIRVNFEQGLVQNRKFISRC
jgi:hypothetical protein